jgi:CheY-like chemotaxis protein
LNDLDLLRELEDYTALVVDDSALARDVLAYALRTLGIGQVTSASRVSEARRRLQLQPFDIVLCDYHFSTNESTGQDLLEEIRSESLLPLSSIFVMVTGEASYEKVVEVAETAPDDYLLKPFTPETLLQRLTAIARRKLWLTPIYRALSDVGEEAALAAAESLVGQGGPYWLYAARFAAELCVRLGRHARARELYDAVLASKAVPWARIGLARNDHAEGGTAKARAALQSLVEEQPYYVDAYDMLGRLMIEAGDLDEALEVFGNASRVTPNSLRRLQQFGSLAFALGSHEEAAASLRKAIRVGSGSRALDPHCVVQLALLKLDAGASVDIERLRATLSRLVDASPGDARLVDMARIVDCAHALATRQPGRAVELVESLCTRILSPDFDLPLACDTVALLARLRLRELDLADAPLWLRDLGLRFISSKNSLLLLMGNARDCPEVTAVLQEAHVEVNATCNDAMAMVLEKRALEGVRGLLKPASTWSNARVLSLIETLSEKNRATDPDAFERVLQLSRRLRGRLAA